MSKRLDRAAIEEAFKATATYITTGDNSRTATKLRSVQFTNLGKGLEAYRLAVDLRKGDTIHLGEHPLARERAYDKRFLGKVVLGDDIVFLEKLPASHEDNVAFMAPLIDDGTVPPLPYIRLRRPKSPTILLRLTPQDIEERVRVISPTDVMQLSRDERIFNPAKIWSNL